MAAGSLAFGLAIPWLTGLYGTLGPRDSLFWVGLSGFVVLAFAIWAGNRWLLFQQRRHFDWFNQPLRKLMMLVTANVLYTAPVTMAGLVAWYALLARAPDWPTIQLVVLTNVICVLFVTHAYETIFLIRERESDLMQVERLERARAEAELGALKAQVDPHFLFNSLNTLGHLVTRDAKAAREFCDALAEVYRYVLASRERDLVPLAEELAFLRRYHRLLELRFGPGAVRLDVAPPVEAAAALRLPPLALQTLLENAVKHNRVGIGQPLSFSLAFEAATEVAGGGRIVAANPRQQRSSALPGAGLGLANLDERCRLVAGHALALRTDGERFEVSVPVVAAGAAGSAAR